MKVIASWKDGYEDPDGASKRHSGGESLVSLSGQFLYCSTGALD